MFGISWAEFLVILIIAIAVIPAKQWPEVAKFLAKIIKFIRDLIWKITDNVEQIKDKIDLEKPITELSQKTMDDVMSAFSVEKEDSKKSIKHKPTKNLKAKSYKRVAKKVG